MLHVKKIVGKLLSSNSYLLFEDGSADCFVVDAGDADALLVALPMNLTIKGVFLTHTHFDHISGVGKIVERFPKCLVYTSVYGKMALGDAKKNFSYYHENSFVYQGENIIILAGGDKVRLFDDFILEVIETLGHCPSCLTYCLGDYIFTGDSYIPGADVVTKLPKGNVQQAAESKKAIMLLATGKMVCAGHDIENWVSLFQS